MAEPVGEAIESKARSTSRSSVSRRFKQATETALAELLARDLSKLDVAVLMIDGIVSHECCCVAALVVTADGTKVPVGLWDGDTENKTGRYRPARRPRRAGPGVRAGAARRDRGAKALAAGIARVFGQHAPVKRCVLHKRRNVASHLPDDLARTTDRRLAQAFVDTDATRGRRVAQGIARQLEAKHPSAAASLREGLDEMFTIRRLGVSDRLARSLSCTNLIESMISVVRDLTDRVTHWQDAWSAAGSEPGCSRPSAASGA